MFIEERHQAILDIINTEGRIKVSDIQRKFAIGFNTARRDLEILEEKGLLKRTHGGAIAVKQIGFTRSPKTTIRDITEVKKNYLLIAKKAVSMIKERDVIYITSATISYFMAQNLPDNIIITAVTNSIIIAEELRTKDNIHVILIGGEMDAKGNCYEGFAIEIIKKLRFDKCFLTSACISSAFGLSIQRSSAITFYNSVIDNSKQAIGLYPTEKVGFDSIVSICPADRLDIIITDWDAPEDELKKFRELGIKVTITDEEN